MRQRLMCDRCNGTGESDRNPGYECSVCDGHGWCYEEYGDARDEWLKADERYDRERAEWERDYRRDVL